MKTENANAQIKLLSNPVCEISKEGIELFIQLTALVELVKHESYNREDLIAKLAACDRLLANTCYEDLLRIRESYKIISSDKPSDK